MAKFDWYGDYNPTLSWRNALDKAQEIMDRSLQPGPANADQVMYDVACIQMWVQIAQVHATNANTELLKKMMPPEIKAELRFH